MKFSERNRLTRKSWRAWLTIHTRETQLNLADNATAQTAFQAGCHLGIEAGRMNAFAEVIELLNREENGYAWWVWIQGGLGGTLHDDLRQLLYEHHTTK